MALKPGRKLSFLICAVLLAGVAAVYWPLAHAPFIVSDDPEYVYENPHVLGGLTWQNIAWAFTHAHSGNWHPLTWMSHMLDCQLFGLNAGAHHLVNVIFHAINTLLLFLLLQKITGTTWRSAFVAAIFGWHPLHVESVAWVSERKDVLSAFFFILTLWSYATYTEKITSDPQSVLTASDPQLSSKARGVGIRSAHICYLFALLFFACGLMCKPMVVTTPFVLLLLDYWPLGRWQSGNRALQRRLLLEKAPFFLLALLSCVVTFFAQRTAGAVASLGMFPLSARIANSLVSYIAYLRKALWPVGLAMDYPFRARVGFVRLAIAIFLLAGMTRLALSSVRVRPWLSMGWFWYLGTLIPVIGLVQAGDQSMADRYTYIPLIGPSIIVAWVAEEMTRGWRHRVLTLTAASTAVLGACLALTAPQVRLWQNGETLFRHSIAVIGDTPHAQIDLGVTLSREGKYAEAGEHFSECVRMSPHNPMARTHLGSALAGQGKLDEAISEYRAALATNPNLGQTHYLLASALIAQGNLHEAIAECEMAIRFQPENAAALNNFAWLLATSPDARFRDGPKAVEMARRACSLSNFQNPQLLGTLAAALAEAGNFDEAIAAARKACDLASSLGQTNLVKRNQELLRLYENHQPYREAK